MFPKKWTTQSRKFFPSAAEIQGPGFTKSYEPALPALLMQKRHLSGVLVNLLQNAREAMNGRGEIEITAKYGENDSIRIIISDTGPGISADKIDKIFEASLRRGKRGPACRGWPSVET